MVITLMELLQRRTQRSVIVAKARCITRLKAVPQMGNEGCAQRRITQRVLMVGQQAAFGINSRDLLADRAGRQQRCHQHIRQSGQRIGQLFGGALEKVRRAAAERGGVQPSAACGQPGHQPLVILKSLAAGKQQVLQQMGQPRPRVRFMMAAHLHLQQRGGACGLRIVDQLNP